MNTIELIICNSYGDPNCGDWETVTVEVPGEIVTTKNHDAVVEWVQENLDVIGENCVFCGVYNWEPSIIPKTF